MVSRRNFVTITLMILILFFMFQFSGVAKGALNEYGMNQYEKETVTALLGQEIYQPLLTQKELASAGSTVDYVVYIGDTKENSLQQVVYWWCSYSKRKLLCAESLDSLSFPEDYLPDVIILDSAHLDFEQELDVLEAYISRGINLIFANLPEAEIIAENEKLRSLLGIRYMIADEVSLKGMHLFGGFLLGGESIYELEDGEEEMRQDFNLTIPWYVTNAGTKTYLSGTIENEETKNELLPAVIWRNSLGTAKVFAVNGDYLSDMTGIGILEAMMAEMHPYEIYPVVNAQNLVVANYPGLASENQEEMLQNYSQNQKALYREIIWPGLVSITRNTKDRLTCLIAPQLDYEDGEKPDGEVLLYYLKLIKEEYGEAGLSGSMVSDTPMEQKLSEDTALFKQYVPNYAVLSFYIKEETLLPDLLNSPYLTQLRTITTGGKDYKEAVISYADADVTLQRATSSGRTHTFSDDLRVKSVETALGYSNIVLDLEDAAYPKTEEDFWEKLSKNITSNLCTYWKPYEAFEKTTLSESDLRIRRFLALDFSDARSGDLITMDISGFEEEAWFLLRLNAEEIKTIRGASYTKVEAGAYLIHAVSDYVEITVEKEANIYYYEAALTAE